MNYECDIIHELDVITERVEENMDMEDEFSNSPEMVDAILYTAFSPMALAERRKARWKMEFMGGVR